MSATTITIPDIRELYQFLVSVFTETPIASVVLLAYPIGMFLGIYWTQALKRNQYKRFMLALRDAKEFQVAIQPPRRYTSFELAGISAIVSGIFIAVMARTFFKATNEQVVAHFILGGSSAPGLFWLVFTLAKWKFPEWADKLRCGDRRRRNKVKDGEMPAEQDRRDPDTTGEFWSAD